MTWAPQWIRKDFVYLLQKMQKSAKEGELEEEEEEEEEWLEEEEEEED